MQEEHFHVGMSLPLKLHLISSWLFQKLELHYLTWFVNISFMLESRFILLLVSSISIYTIASYHEHQKDPKILVHMLGCARIVVWGCHSPTFY